MRFEPLVPHEAAFHVLAVVCTVGRRGSASRRAGWNELDGAVAPHGSGILLYPRRAHASATEATTTIAFECESERQGRDQRWTDRRRLRPAGEEGRRGERRRSDFEGGRQRRDAHPRVEEQHCPHLPRARG